MELWNYHDKKMRELKQLYNKISKQTQNELQALLDTFNITYENLYSIVESKTKRKINTYIEQWNDQGLLNDTYFKTLAESIYRRARVKSNEILELIIYSAYIYEQSKIDKQEKEIMYEDASFYYQEGQKEVKDKIKASALEDALFLYLLTLPTYSGLTFEQYKRETARYNAQQIYKQSVLNITQQKDLNVDNEEFKKIFERQNNSKLGINNNKIYGAIDLTQIGINNQAKIEGIKKVAGKDAKVRFIAVTDEHSTDVCQSLKDQEFYINKENIFYRMYGETQSELRKEKIRCFGLVQGLNLPPILHYFHYCRSSITYQGTIENNDKKEYNADYIRKNKYTNSKNLDTEIKKAINMLPSRALNLLKDTKIKTTSIYSCYDRKKDTIYLLKNADKYEILHEIGHVIETKLNILHDRKYIEIQEKGLEIQEMHTGNIEGYAKEYEFWKDGNKFVSDYQRRVYEKDIDGNYKLNYENFTFNSKTLGEYFSEGFRCYFQENNLLKRKDIELYNYIKEILK